MISKANANYTEKAKKDFCIDCIMSRLQATKCTYVVGMIKPSGHCDYFKLKNKLPVEKK